MVEITGADAEALIQSQIVAHSGGIASTLARFEPESAFYATLDTIRAIEELINLPLFGLDEDEALAEQIAEFRLDQLNPASLAIILRALTAKFGAPFAQRFQWTVLQASAIGAAFRLHGLFEAAAGFQTIAHAIGYFQSRRRHLMAMLYALPTAACGTMAMDRLDTINQLLPQIEHSGLTITGLYQKLMLAKVFPDFALLIGADGFSANHDYETLDTFYMEPERAGIVEIQKSGPGTVSAEELEALDPALLFSAAELRNDIRLMEASYAEFDLAATTFGAMARLARDMLAYCEDDYRITISARKFDDLYEQSGLPGGLRARLIHSDGDYVACTNAVAPVIAIGDNCVSTVTFLSRFLYNWRSICLNRSRRFQIRSGFIFEQSVKAELARQGFAVTDIRRINHKEFDVVATFGHIIYNVQCKNNLVDLAQIERDPTRFARYNRQLDRYYARALAKEEARESLLRAKLGLEHVRHFVVSRFPVATTNPRVIAFSQIGRFRDIATE